MFALFDAVELPFPPLHEGGLPLFDNLDAALLEEFSDVKLAQTETVVESESVLDDAKREPVAVRLAVSHRRLASRA